MAFSLPCRGAQVRTLYGGVGLLGPRHGPVAPLPDLGGVELRQAHAVLPRTAPRARTVPITPSAVRTAINEGRLTRTLLHKRTSLIAREDVERYRREHRGRQGKRPQPDDLTEQQRKQRAYQQAYYQRRKAARQQPATEPAE
jgi:hypothetical protein